MSEHIGEAHIEADEYPGVAAEEMHAHAIENAVAPLVAALAGEPCTVGETRTVDIQLVVQCSRQSYDGVAPDTVSITATVLTGNDRQHDLAQVEADCCDLVRAGTAVELVKAAAERGAVTGIRARHAS